MVGVPAGSAPKSQEFSSHQASGLDCGSSVFIAGQARTHDDKTAGSGQRRWVTGLLALAWDALARRESNLPSKCVGGAVEIVLGVSMTPTTVSIALVEGEKADGVIVERDVFDITAVD